MGHLRVERLSRRFDRSAVPGFDQHSLAAAHHPLHVDGEVVEGLRDAREHIVENGLPTYERTARPVWNVLGLVPLHVLVENFEKRWDVPPRQCLMRQSPPPRLRAVSSSRSDGRCKEG